MKNKILTGALVLMVLITTGGWIVSSDINDELREATHEHKDDINKKSTEIANLENVIIKKDTDLESQKVVIDEQDSQINELLEENANIEQENQTLKSHKEQLQSENDSLKKTNSDLQSQLKAEKAKKKVVSQSKESVKSESNDQVVEVSPKVKRASNPTKSEAKTETEAKVETEVKTETEKSEGRSITVSATAYVAMCDTGCTGITATGIDVRNTIHHNGLRVIAVDPSVIPLHSVVRVSVGGQSFTAIALDTGGAIKGNKIDILVGSTDEAWSFGRQQATITILK